MSGTISYTLTEQDIVTSLRLQYLRRAVSRRSLGTNAFFLAVLWLAILGVNLKQRAPLADSALSALTACAVALGGTLLMSAVGYAFAAHRGRRLFRQQRTLHDAYEVTWSEAGLEVHGTAITSKLSWSDHESWQKEALGYLIYLSDYNFNLLPRRAFTDDQQEDFESTMLRSGLRLRSTASQTVCRPDGSPSPGAVLPGRRNFAWLRRPASVAWLWLILTILTVVDALLFPGKGNNSLGSALFLSGTPIFSGLLAAAALRLRSSTLKLITLLLVIALASEAGWLAAELVLPVSSEEPGALIWLFWGAPMLFTVALIWLRYASRSGLRRAVAVFLLIVTNVVGSTLTQADPIFWRASAEVRSLLELGTTEQEKSARPAMPDVAADRLWGAQPALVSKGVEGLRPRISGQLNLYAVAVAGSGTQTIFSREAHRALMAIETRFGARYRGGLLLSNGAGDLLRTPLATQDNMIAAAQGIAAKIDPTRDVAFVYLTSHGSRTAELETDLADYSSLTPISSSSVDNALRRSGLRRRVIVISACFAGSWVPTLANDDTIVIAAARRDRTSFGCDDTRQLTYFGQAFLAGLLTRGTSLRAAFEMAQRTIMRWETEQKLPRSEPQVFVGRNMRALWASPSSSN